MKLPILLSTLLLGAVAACAQPADTAPKLVNDLPFPLVAPARVQTLAVAAPLVIKLDDATLGAALDELQKQSGVEFGTAQANFNNQLDTKVSVDIDTLSFNEAFRQIMEAANLKGKLQDWGDENLHLSFGGSDGEVKPLKSGVGLFEIALSSVAANFNRSVNLTNFEAPQRSERGSLDVSLDLQSDRRLPLVGSPQARVTRAEDDQGRSLVPQLDDNGRAQTRVNRYNYYGNSSWQQRNSSLSLNLPASDAKTLAHLEGVVVYAVVSKSEKWEVPDLLSKPQWARTFANPDGTVAVTIAATPNDDEEGGGLKVKIEAISSNEDQAFERVTYPLEQIEPLMGAMRIVDASGTVYRSQGYNATGGQTMKISTTFVPENREFAEEAEAAKPQAKGPFRLIMDAPVEVVQTEVPFAFENVPLP